VPLCFAVFGLVCFALEHFLEMPLLQFQVLRFRTMAFIEHEQELAAISEQELYVHRVFEPFVRGLW
jgi:hypothetical protein